MFYNKTFWRYIRLYYRGQRRKNTILKHCSCRALNIPWILCFLKVRLVIYQCLWPWIFRLRIGHSGARIGEFWRTRYLKYAQKVLIFKKKKKI